MEELAAIADGAGISMTHMAVSFTLAHPAVTSAIVGVRTPQQIEELIAGADVRLDEATLDAIDAVVPPGSTLDENDMGFAPWWMEAVPPAPLPSVTVTPSRRQLRVRLADPRGA